MDVIKTIFIEIKIEKHSSNTFVFDKYIIALIIKQNLLY